MSKTRTCPQCAETETDEVCPLCGGEGVLVIYSQEEIAAFTREHILEILGE